jgi:hypothetical protein
MMKKILKGMLIYIAVTFFIGVPAALIGGFWPKTALGWALILIFAVPIMFVLSLIGEILFADRVSDTLDSKRKTKKLSFWRMAYTLLVAAIYFGLVLFISLRYGDSLKTHFYLP